MTSSQESVDSAKVENDLAAKEKAVLERIAKERAEGKSWRLRQLRRMASGPNSWAAPKKD